MKPTEEQQSELKSLIKALDKQVVFNVLVETKIATTYDCSCGHKSIEINDGGWHRCSNCGML